MTITRPATQTDAAGMCAVINPIIADGTTTGHRKPFTPDRMLAHYIGPPLGIACTIALDGDGIAGFQALELADPAWQGPGKLPRDWALVASFVAMNRQGQGIGQALWPHSLAAARTAGVTAIDATIRADNAPGLAYYTGLGFTDYSRRIIPLSDGTLAERISKTFTVTA